MISQHKPTFYGVQPPFRHCGAYTIKAILSAFGLDHQEHAVDYYTNGFFRMLGFMRPRMFMKILQENGIATNKGNLQGRSRPEKIEFLKESLKEKNPIVLLVFNGYKRNGKYFLFKSFFCIHRITLRGFDDEKRVFYVYDSTVPKHKYDPSLPIGNKAVTYEKLLRDWAKGNIYGIFRYLYIKVHSMYKK